MIPAKYRTWIYTVATAGLAAAAVYGLVNEEQLAALGAIVAALTTGLARANVSE